MTASISARNLTVEVPYFLQEERVGGGWLETLMSAASSIPRRKFATLLDGITFDAVEGDRIALIGRNGAGKTTLLRTLTGAFPPTKGSIEVIGTRQALLNLGNGFNSEATLLENIFLRATAMGLPAKSIRDLAMSILEFAELTDIAGRRMTTLSSGQRMRLGFAIATSVRSEILLLDEWLGTGDAHFVKKARNRLTDHVHGSKIVVVASHNQTLTTKLCNRGLVLDKGRLVYFGALDKAMREYQKLYPKAAVAKPAKPRPASPPKDTNQPKAGASAQATTAVAGAKFEPEPASEGKSAQQLAPPGAVEVAAMSINSEKKAHDVAAN